MKLRVQHVDGEYRVVLSAEALEALHLTEGSAVELRPVAAPEASAEVSPKHRYATKAEALEAFNDTYSQHENTYRELAK